MGRVREAVEATRALLEGERTYRGEHVSADRFTLAAPPSGPVRLFVGALGPRMLRLAGAIGDGVCLNLMPPEVVPRQIAEIRRGNTAAFRALYEAHKAAVFNVCMRISGSLEEAEDLMQETFLSAFRNIDRFQAQARISTWLYRIAVNKSLNHRRKRRILRWLSLDALSGEASAPDRDRPDVAAQMNEREQRLWQAIDALPERQRAAIVLNRFEGLSYEETAGVLGCSISSVESLLHRAKRQLQQVLSAMKKDG